MFAHEQEDHDDRPRPFSFTLELDRQLDNESNSSPNSPADASGRPHSLDPHILSSIIIQLRTSLADVTRERDDLSHTVAEQRAREAGTADTIAHIMEKCSKMQEELDVANAKTKDDEDTISVLRTKVEESRRGLMRLQSERRVSQVPSTLDLSRASIASLSGPLSSKRASFNPLIGSVAGRNNAHKRMSSLSDSNFPFLDTSSHFTPPVTTPANFNLPDVQKSRTQPPASRRQSGMFARASPPQSLYPSEEFAELEMLRRELNTIKVELDDAKHELNESNEAREASETCVKVLREFIEENQVGAVPKSLPSLPGEVKKATPAAAGWGFKLWRGESVSQSPILASPPPVAHAASPSLSSLPPFPLSKKLGDFFGTRAPAASVSSTPLPVGQEPMYNGLSDTSSLEDSMTEPISPASERPRPSVYVRDSTSATTESSLSASVTTESSRDLNLDLDLEGKLLSPAADEVLAHVAI